jgi:hypothetical protein
MARITACLLLCAMAGAVLWGCSSSTEPDLPADLPYPLRTSPDSLLAQLRWAYEHEDLDVYMECLADSFTFYLCEDDWTNDPTLPQFWRRLEEDAIHTNMFAEAGSVDRITLTLTTTDVDTVSIPDGRGVGWVYEESVDLRVYVGSTIYLATQPNAFTIRLDPDEVGPNAEALYEIWAWRELDHWRGGASSMVSRSWGSVKAMFR